MLRAFVFILLANLVFAAIIVPNVKVFQNEKNGFEIKQSNDGYDLSVKNDGSSRVENVREVTPGELSVDGLYKQEFGNKLQLAVKYNAGIEGYLANYTIRPNAPLVTLKPTTSTPQPSFLPPACLKACTG